MPLSDTDRKLVNNLLSGTADGWSSFVDRYSGLIVHVIRHTAHAHSLRLKDDDVDDLVADVFTVLLEKNMQAIRSFRGRSSFATFLTVIVRRIVLRKLTQRRYLQAWGHVQAHNAAIADSAPESSSSTDAKDEVDNLMSRLSEPFKSLVRLFYLEGASYRQISQRLNLPLNSIGPSLARARNLLRSRDQHSA